MDNARRACQLRFVVELEGEVKARAAARHSRSAERPECGRVGLRQAGPRAPRSSEHEARRCAEEAALSGEQNPGRRAGRGVDAARQLDSDVAESGSSSSEILVAGRKAVRARQASLSTSRKAQEPTRREARPPSTNSCSARATAQRVCGSGGVSNPCPRTATSGHRLRGRCRNETSAARSCVFVRTSCRALAGHRPSFLVRRASEARSAARERLAHERAPIWRDEGGGGGGGGEGELARRRALDVPSVREARERGCTCRKRLSW